jgi:hypothetical protein
MTAARAGQVVAVTEQRRNSGCPDRFDEHADGGAGTKSGGRQKGP